MSSPLSFPDLETEEDIDELTDEESAEEPPYRVLVHNDDVTPFDFVILILVRIFELSPIIAELKTYQAHTQGMALVAVLPKSEAERRVGKAVMAARLEGYPLDFTIEPED